MSHLVESQAITLKQSAYREHDALVAFYTPQQGLIRAVAKGIKKPNSKLLSACFPLALNQIGVRFGKTSLGNLEQTQRLITFGACSENLQALSHLGIFSEIVYLLKHESDTASIFDWLLAMHIQLEECCIAKQPAFPKIILGHRNLLEITGYGPNWQICMQCDELLDFEGNTYFTFCANVGGFFCQRCIREHHPVMLREKVNVSTPTIQLFLNPQQPSQTSEQQQKLLGFLQYYWQFRLEKALESFNVLFQMNSAFAE